ncbi:acyl-CoA dehydrogenase family protein, partial [Galactobacter sp.]|uniref:acyl-CoA dehydrogenase family protein n=1 Tax=Galactobacter sp. TaxID=2676125 RepID=UPI00345CF5A6
PNPAAKAANTEAANTESTNETDPSPAVGQDHERVARLRAHYAPLLERIREGAARRDQTRELPRQEIRDLAAAGFGALRVPQEYGGEGLTVPEFFELVTDLAAADSNLAQALRGHFALVEDRLLAPLGASRDRWLRRFVAGEIAGNAWTEVGSTQLGGVNTVVTRHEDGTATVTGEKYYSTGSIFADWIDVWSRDAATGEDVISLVSTRQDAVELSDDWTGFGQRTTGTGTTVFRAAKVEEVVPVTERFRYQTALYQQVLLSVLAGVARAASRDVGAVLAARKRGYSHGNAEETSRDPQLLAVVGEVDSAAFAAAAVSARAAEALQGAYDAGVALRAAQDSVPDGEDVALRTEALRVADDAAVDRAELATAQGQVALSTSVPAAVTRLFDALGASATDTGTDLDRHWRNARTAASHNPWVYKARIVGEHVVHGEAPVRLWSVGKTSAASSAV